MKTKLSRPGKFLSCVPKETRVRIVLIFTVLYVLFFLILAVIQGNYEFMFYILLHSGLILLVIIFSKQLHLPFYIILLLSILGIMHFVGGNLSIGGIRVYDVVFFRGALRYDNIMHFIGSFLLALLAYNILVGHIDREVKHNPFFLSLLIVLVASGLAAFNEIIEFIGVVFFDAAGGVGTYLNNALDLVYNIIGAILASVVIVRYNKKLI